MAFAGYLLASIVGTTITPFPNKYIEFESWDSTPDQREEIVAYRDDNTRDLTRVTAAGKKTVFSFNIREGINLAEKTEIMNFFYDAEEDHEQRKIKLQFWNDDTNSYDVGYFYRPNMHFPIKRITGNDIIYKQLTLDFVEY